MSSSSNARGSIQSDRHFFAPGHASNTKPRVPSTRPDERDRGEARSTHSQHHSGAGVTAKRPSSGSQRTIVDQGKGDIKRIEEISVTTKESLSVRTRKSPVKTTRNPTPDTESVHRERELSEAESRLGTGSSVGLRKDQEGEREDAGGRLGTGSSAELKKKEKKQQKQPWAPHATLIPRTTAPLASRVSIPPRTYEAPDSLQSQPLNQLTTELQEAAILEDLLFVFMGYEGQYIHFSDSYNPSIETHRLAGPRFRIRSGLDPSLRDLTTTMLKMATHYVAVDAFVEVQSRFEFGAVNHALCAAIRKLLKGYLELITQLEHQVLTNSAFTLQTLHLHTISSSHMLLQLYSLVHEITLKNSTLEEKVEKKIDVMDDMENLLEELENAPKSIPTKRLCKGGSVLGLITKRLGKMAGDPAARSLLTSLLQDASRPYMTMLNEWLHHGGIKDPHGEFLIRERDSIKREKLEEDYTDEYWEKRYTIRENDVPPQLEAVKGKVLLAGKYLNVVRVCGGVDISKEVKDVPNAIDDIRFLENVNGAYANANSSLMKLLLTTHALSDRLCSLKHYFLLDRSDFLNYFLELGASELKKPAKAVNVVKLQSLLDMVIRHPGSIAAQERFKEDVHVEMNLISLANWLMRVNSVTGIDQEPQHIDQYQTSASQSLASLEDKDLLGYDALCLEYSVPFPLSLVLSRKTIIRYQLLFRYITSMRHLESLLVNCWKDHSKEPSWRHKSSDPALEMWKRRAWTLRTRMLIFVQQVLYFVTAEVLEPNWRALMARLEGTDQQRRESGINERPLNRTVDEVMQDHVDFLDTCLKECMLTSTRLIKIHSKIMNTCSLFATYTAHLSRALISADPDLASTPTSSQTLPSSSQTTSSQNPPPPPSISISSSSQNPPSQQQSTSYDKDRLARISDSLARYEDNFARNLKVLMDVLNYTAATETVVLLGLCARLSMACERLGDAGR